MFHIACNSCGKSAVTADPSDPDSLVQCGCCPQTHHHGQAANECPGAGGNHPGQACPVGPYCTAVTPAGEDCPGGHCHKDVPGCTVCRPITITLLPGSARVGMG